MARHDHGRSLRWCTAGAAPRPAMTYPARGPAPGPGFPCCHLSWSAHAPTGKPRGIQPAWAGSPDTGVVQIDRSSGPRGRGEDRHGRTRIAGPAHAGRHDALDRQPHGNTFGAQGPGAGGGVLSDLLGGLGLGGGSAGGNPLSDLLGGLGGSGGAGDKARDMLGDAVASPGRTRRGRRPGRPGRGIPGRQVRRSNGALGGGALACSPASPWRRSRARTTPSRRRAAAIPPRMRRSDCGSRRPRRGAGAPGQGDLDHQRDDQRRQGRRRDRPEGGATDRRQARRRRRRSAGASVHCRRDAQAHGHERAHPAGADATSWRSRSTPPRCWRSRSTRRPSRDYLRQLAQGLRLDPTTVQQVQQTLGVQA